MRRITDIFLRTLAVLAAIGAVVKVVREDDETEVDGGQPGRSVVVGSAELRLGGRRTTSGEAPDAPEAPPEPSLMARFLEFAKHIAGRIKRHNTVIIAAALAYYAFFAVFPAAIAALSIYGLVADPVELENQLIDLTAALPAETAKFVQTQLLGVTQLSGLGIATIAGIALALWSASAGTKALISGINIAYNEKETRGFAFLRALALGLTVGMIVFVVAAVAATTVLPPLLDDFGLESETITLINIVRWPAVVLTVLLGLGLLYKVAPNRPLSASPWINWGAVFAAIAWVLATFGLSLYSTFGEAGAAYGALAGLALLMLWFFVSGLVVLVGAEINDELEERNVYD